MTPDDTALVLQAGRHIQAHGNRLLAVFAEFDLRFGVRPSDMLGIEFLASRLEGDTLIREAWAA